MLKNVDFEDFWADVNYADDYNEPEPSDELILELENELGYKLPESYVKFMKKHNGGVPKYNLIPVCQPGYCFDVGLLGIFGIGKEKPNTICGSYGTKFMVEEWGYPDIGVAICDCFSAGHEMIFLDYRECGPKGEPKVSYVDQEWDYEITIIADSFEEFIGALKMEV